MLQLSNNLILSFLLVISQQVQILPRLVVQRLIECVRGVDQCVLHVDGLELVAVEWGVILHCISECGPEHILAGHGVLWQTELMEGWQLLNFELLVVWEGD